MLPIQGEIQGIVAIAGFLSGRTAARPNRGGITLIINGRVVTNPDLASALESAYRPFLPRGRHPFAVVTLDVPPAEIDPNVHPAKAEIRLADEIRIAEHLAELVRDAFANAPAQIDAAQDFALIGDQGQLPLGTGRVREIGGHAWGWEQRSWRGEPAHGRAIPVAELRVVAQVQQALILAEGPGGLYLVDQHRAHERSIYERLNDRDRSVESQALLDPIVVELGRPTARLLDERLDELERIGFTVERFGSHDFLVRAVPALTGAEPLPDLSDILADAAADGESWRQRLLISIACRAAIRRFQPLARPQMEGLLRDLAQTSAPAACPHGSPLILQVGQEFLARQFRW
jgi:DNA mismatch repair protein MutL